MEKIIQIEGMSCAHCANAVEKALNAVPGVSSAHVDLAAKTATVNAATDVSEETLKDAVTDAGYTATKVQ